MIGLSDDVDGAPHLRNSRDYTRCIVHDLYSFSRNNTIQLLANLEVLSTIGYCLVILFSNVNTCVLQDIVVG